MLKLLNIAETKYLEIFFFHKFGWGIIKVYTFMIKKKQFFWFCIKASKHVVSAIFNGFKVSFYKYNLQYLILPQCILKASMAERTYFDTFTRKYGYVFVNLAK